MNNLNAHASTKVECPNGQVVLLPALIMLKGALKLEILGMKRRGETAYAQTKRLFLLKGSKQSVYDQYVTILKRNKIISEE